MGIRFACHVCDKRLNIKQELAGKRGVCPACSSRIRIPLTDTEKSMPVELKPESPIGVESGEAAPTPVPATSHDPASRVPSSNHGGSQSALTQSPGGVAANATAIASEEASSAAAPADSHDSPAIDLVNNDPDATWYVRPPSGGQYGPATSDVLRQWIGEGRVATNALLWRDGWPQWRESLDVFPELTGRLPEGSVRTADNRSSDASVPTVLPSSPDGGRRGLAGEVDLGAAKKSRWTRRMMTIGLLSTLAIILIVVLFAVANRS